MTQRERFRRRLLECDTHFDGDQIEAVMQVVEESGYSEMYRALKEITELAPRDKLRLPYAIQAVEIADKALAKAEMK